MYSIVIILPRVQFPRREFFWAHFSIDISCIAHILIHSDIDVHDARQIRGRNTSVPAEFVKKKYYKLPRKTISDIYIMCPAVIIQYFNLQRVRDCLLA
jgi:hypothetical protein